MTLSQLKQKATASELTLIEAVEYQLKEEMTRKVFDTFDSHLRDYLGFMCRSNIAELRDILEKVVQATLKDLKLI